MSCRLKHPNSYAVRNLKKYLNLQNKVLLAYRLILKYTSSYSIKLISFLLFTELIDFKTRRVAAFRKNLVELAELELKHAKVSVTLKLNNLNDF